MPSSRDRSWPTCGSPADWILPKFALLRAVMGALKFTWFRTLKTSQRNCTVFVFCTVKVRLTEMSF